MIPCVKIIGDITQNRNGLLQTIQISTYIAKTCKTDRLVLARRKWHDVPGSGK